MAKKGVAGTWRLAAELLALQQINSATTVNGSAVNVEPELPEKITAVLFALPNGGDADETLNVKIQGSRDGGSSWEDVTNGAFAEVGQPDGASMKHITVEELYPDYRAVATTAGTTPDFHVAVGLIEGDLAHVGTAAT